MATADTLSRHGTPTLASYYGNKKESRERTCRCRKDGWSVRINFLTITTGMRYKYGVSSGSSARRTINEGILSTWEASRSLGAAVCFDCVFHTWLCEFSLLDANRCRLNRSWLIVTECSLDARLDAITYNVATLELRETIDLWYEFRGGLAWYVRMQSSSP